MDEMKRPHVICHILMSMDGRISGSFMEEEACLPALMAYGSLRGELNCTATLYGTTTMAESYSDGFIKDAPHTEKVFERRDYVAAHDTQHYVVSIDPAGQLAFPGAYIEKKGRAKAHVIEVLLSGVSDDYLAYLHEKGISYIFAGQSKLDCGLALEKLHRLFGVQRLILAGGGVMNATMLRAGLVDEMSLVVAPVISGDRRAATLADYTGKSMAHPAFALREALPLDGHALWLRYTKA